MSVLFADSFRLPFDVKVIGNRFGTHDIENGHDLYGPQGHRGVDFKVGAGAAIPAIANGEVSHVLWSDALGNVTVLRHYLHGANNDVYSGYCHQSATLVKPGQVVKIGQTIGHTGSTGSACYGPHLHLTLSHSDTGVEFGEVIDPLAFIAAHATKPAVKPPAPAFTNALRGEGLIRIAERSHISFDQIKKLNPNIKAPSYIVLLGQKIRVR